MNKNDKDKSTQAQKNIYTTHIIPIGTKTVKELLKELIIQTHKSC